MRVTSSRTPRQRRARNDAVLHDVVRRDAPDGCERRLAALPDESALLGRLRNANLPRAILPAEFRGIHHLRGHFRFRAIQFHQQQRLADGVVGMDRGFRGHCGEPIHHLQRGRQHSGGDDVGDGLRRGGNRVERGQQHLHGLRALDDAQDDLGRDAQGAFRADEDAGEIVARRIGCGRAEARPAHRWAEQRPCPAHAWW